jgi:hypothetical protein
VLAGSGTVSENACTASLLSGRRITVVRRPDQTQSPYGECNGDPTLVKAATHVVKEVGWLRQAGWVGLYRFAPGTTGTSAQQRIADARVFTWREGRSGSLVRLTCQLIPDAAGESPYPSEFTSKAGHTESDDGWLLADINITGGSCLLDTVAIDVVGS